MLFCLNKFSFCQILLTKYYQILPTNCPSRDTTSFQRRYDVVRQPRRYIHVETTSCVYQGAIFFPVSQFLLYLFFLSFPTGFYTAPFSSLLIRFQFTKYKFSNCFLTYLKRELSSQKTMLLSNDSEIDRKNETRVLVKFFSSTILIFFHCWHIFDIFSIVSTYCLIQQKNILRKKCNIIQQKK